MDLTLSVMLPPRGATDFAESAHPKWRVLSIVSIHACRYRDEVVTSERMGVIHVMRAPFKTASEASEALTQPIVEDLLIADPPIKNYVREKREYAGDWAAFSEKHRDDLLTRRQITMEWTEFKLAYAHIDSGLKLALSSRVLLAEVK